MKRDCPQLATLGQDMHKRHVIYCTHTIAKRQRHKCRSLQNNSNRPEHPTRSHCIQLLIVFTVLDTLWSCVVNLGAWCSDPARVAGSDARMSGSYHFVIVNTLDAPLFEDEYGPHSKRTAAEKVISVSASTCSWLLSSFVWLIFCRPNEHHPLLPHLSFDWSAKNADF